jgi:hypothetical protein
MSYTTITMATRDSHLVDRVRAAAVKEAWSNQALGDTTFGKKLKDYPEYGAQFLIWPVAVDTEAAYEFAINNGVPTPGRDVGVIPDANILSAVQVHWPMDPEPAP